MIFSDHTKDAELAGLILYRKQLLETNDPNYIEELVEIRKLEKLYDEMVEEQYQEWLKEKESERK